MHQAIITTVHDWAKRSAREEHLGNMVFLNRNTAKYDWDNEDLSDVVDLSSLRITPRYITTFTREAYLERTLKRTKTLS